MRYSKEFTNACKEGELAAERTARSLGIPLDRPVDVFSIIERSNIWLFFQRLDGILGLYLPSSPPGILINSARPIGVQRLTAAHEFGHHVLGHGTAIDRDDLLLRAQTGHRSVTLSQSRFILEAAAYAFALTFLTPAQLVRLAMERLETPRSGTISADQAYELSLHLGLSYTATLHRLVALRELDSGLAEALSKVRLSTIKRRLGHGQSPQQSRADVWPVRPSLNGSHLVARVGDELVSSLSESPSSGYQWMVKSNDGMYDLDGNYFESNDSDLLLTHTSVGGLRKLKLRLVRPSDTTIVFHHMRPWDPQQSRGEFAVHVHAEDLLGHSFAPRAQTRERLLASTT